MFNNRTCLSSKPLARSAWNGRPRVGRTLYRSPASDLPERAGRSASHGVRRRLNVMATLTLALVRCYGLFCRALLGHVADPRHQLTHPRDRDRFVEREAQSIHPPRREADRFLAGTLEPRPSW